MNKKINIEKTVRNCLIFLTFVSLMITILNLTYATYQNLDIEKINHLLVSYVNTWLLWVDNILLYVFAIAYIVLALKSKKERILKVSFSFFSILTTMITLTFIINIVAELFGMF